MKVFPQTYFDAPISSIVKNLWLSSPIMLGGEELEGVVEVGDLDRHGNSWLLLNGMGSRRL